MKTEATANKLRVIRAVRALWDYFERHPQATVADLPPELHWHCETLAEFDSVDLVRAIHGARNNLAGHL